MSNVDQLANNLAEIVPLTSHTKVKRAQTEKQKAALKTIRENRLAAAAARKKEEEDLKEIDKEELEVRKALYQLDKEKKKAKIAQMKAWVARQQARLKAGKRVEAEPEFLTESDSSSSDDDTASVNPTASVLNSSESESSSESEPEPEPEPLKKVVQETGRRPVSRALERVQRQDNIPVPRSLSPAFAAHQRESSPLGRHTTVRSFVQLPTDEPVNIFARKR